MYHSVFPSFSLLRHNYRVCDLNILLVYVSDTSLSSSLLVHFNITVVEILALTFTLCLFYELIKQILIQMYLSCPGDGSVTQVQSLCFCLFAEANSVTYSKKIST